MAAIDKIYLSSYNEYLKFKNWCLEQPSLFDKYGKEVNIADYLYNHNEEFDGGPVFMAPYYIDAYVIRNCPFDFVQEELMLNYGHYSQERINEMYDIVTNRTERNEDYYSWLTPNDFVIIDGIITYPKNNNSTYARIKRGELYTSPSGFTDYTPGEHFKCIKHPKYKYNKPFKYKYYWVSIELPEYIQCKDELFMRYHPRTKTWDFWTDFVADVSSSHAVIPSIKSLKRYIKKWKLPIGTEINLHARYVFDDYKFIVKK